MWGGGRAANFFLVTQTASLPASPNTAPPPAWGAPAPPPPPPRGGGPRPLPPGDRPPPPGPRGPPAAPAATRRAPWVAGDAEGFALRLAHLGVDGATATALAAESAERLAGRTEKP